MKEDLRGSASYLPSTIHFLARVVKWQTRTFEGRMPQGMGVQVPPRALRLPCEETAQIVNDFSATVDHAFKSGRLPEHGRK
ncbi:MAG: hypothetical protein QOC70_11 [Verrucomicrobiota bacterium]